MVWTRVNRPRPVEGAWVMSGAILFILFLVIALLVLATSYIGVKESLWANSYLRSHDLIGNTLPSAAAV